MIAFFKGLSDRFLGRGDAAVTVPVFDGVLRPNRLLDDGVLWARLEAPGDLACDDTGLWASDGNRVLRIDPAQQGTTEELVLDGTITALARFKGGFAVALDGNRVEVHGGALDGHSWKAADKRAFVAINSLTADGDTLLATDASAHNAPANWQRDLLERRSSGRVLRLGVDGVQMLASGLSHAFGAVPVGDAVWVSESWRHRVVSVLGAGHVQPVLNRLPGYPSRLAPADGGGIWLSVFACRTQLVEFVLREKGYREAMMASMPPNLWVAPQLVPPQSFLEPLQGGAIKQMGVLKPWAPPRSYGLVLRLNEAGKVLYSLHSRVDGTHHGITAIHDHGGALWVVSHGAGGVLRLDPSEIARRAGE
ncbi:hypothetical protein E7681_16140 [Thalassobius vesicularis]|uniref:Strictosidine synthase n=1 Tax=Thalassobius vesicularis TaxID=1294297 RepID=A0A4V6RRV4_9RHOB|nr:hypothetical protein [Thalassobius vesicularis]THD72049.1 hypothetical protein E7681_16140 [Thalassobius vesicularis]